MSDEGLMRVCLSWVKLIVRVRLTVTVILEIKTQLDYKSVHFKIYNIF